jgi:RNA polymerase sporulation-specific sigma factor
MKYCQETVERLLLQEKTQSVVEELIILNMGLLNKQLSRFYLLNDPDALSYGYEALYKAIITFDTSKNIKFSTHATVCIYNRLGSYVRSLNTQIATNVVSYDTPIAEDLTMLDTFESSDTADGAALVRDGVSDIERCVAMCYGNLTNATHRKIAGRWIRSGYTMTQNAIAAELQCSQPYVNQVLRTFKKTLKKKLEAIQ